MPETTFCSWFSCFRNPADDLVTARHQANLSTVAYESEELHVEGIHDAEETRIQSYW